MGRKSIAFACLAAGVLAASVVHRGYLGVQIKELDPEVASRLGLEKQKGVLVTKVFDDSPAARAGLKGGEVITALAGKPVENSHDLQAAVADLPLGEPVDLTVVRDGSSRTLQVKIEEQPTGFGAASERPAPAGPKPEKKASKLEKAGVEVADATPELAKEFGYKGGVKGVLVTDVTPDSPAADAGLHKGVLLVKVDRKPVKSAAEARDAIAKGLDKGTLLQVQGPEGGTDYVVLKAATATAGKE
jgi:serine protease Do